jgi:hypothetical protein
MTDFVNHPLDKLMNRENLFSRLERVERRRVRPSATAQQLGHISSNTGNLIVDGSIIVIDLSTGLPAITFDPQGITLENNANKLMFKDANGTVRGYVFMNTSDEMGILNEKTGGRSLVQARNAAGQANKLYIGEDVEFYVTLTNGTSGALEWREDPGNVNAYQLAIPNATNGSSVAIAGSEIILWGGKDGKTNVFNAGGFDIDHIFYDANGAELLHLDAGAGTVTVAGIASGTYTPTLTNTTNIAASTLNGTFDYIRVGSQVTVAGCVSVDPTAAGNTVLSLSLPFASNFTGAFECNGTASSQATNTAANIASSGATDLAIMTFQATDVSNQTFRLTFTYRIL